MNTWLSPFALEACLRLEIIHYPNFELSNPSTTTPQGKYRFSSDHRSQTLSGEVSTWPGDRLGIPRAVDFSILLFLLVVYLNLLLTAS